MARANADSQILFAAQAFLLEGAFLFAASLCGIGYRGNLPEHSFQPFALIALMALAMGTRNAAVRELAIPDLTTTVLTLAITGIGADSSLANGNNPRLARRVASVAAMFLDAALGAMRPQSPPCALSCCFARAHARQALTTRLDSVCSTRAEILLPDCGLSISLGGS